MKDKDKKDMKIKGGNRGGNRIQKARRMNRKKRRAMNKDLKSKMSLKNFMLKHGMEQPEEIDDRQGILDFLNSIKEEE